MLIFVCSRLRENATHSLQAHIALTMEYCKHVIKAGHTPYAPHLFFTRFLDDTIPEERDAGILGGLETLAKCDELWVFSNDFVNVSSGMQAEINRAIELGIPIVLKDDIYKEYQVYAA